MRLYRFGKTGQTGQRGEVLMTAAPGIVTSGTGPPNAVVQVQPGMQVQPVVLVDQNGQYVTTSGSAATAGYLADLTGSVNVSQAAAPTVST